MNGILNTVPLQHRPTFNEGFLGTCTEALCSLVEKIAEFAIVIFKTIFCCFFSSEEGAKEIQAKDLTETPTETDETITKTSSDAIQQANGIDTTTPESNTTRKETPAKPPRLEQLDMDLPGSPAKALVLETKDPKSTLQQQPMGIKVIEEKVKDDEHLKSNQNEKLPVLTPESIEIRSDQELKPIKNEKEGLVDENDAIAEDTQDAAGQISTDLTTQNQQGIGTASNNNAIVTEEAHEETDLEKLVTDLTPDDEEEIQKQNLKGAVISEKPPQVTQHSKLEEVDQKEIVDDLTSNEKKIEKSNEQGKEVSLAQSTLFPITQDQDNPTQLGDGKGIGKAGSEAEKQVDLSKVKEKNNKNSKKENQIQPQEISKDNSDLGVTPSPINLKKSQSLTNLAFNKSELFIDAEGVQQSSPSTRSKTPFKSPNPNNALQMMPPEVRNNLAAIPLGNSINLSQSGFFNDGTDLVITNSSNSAPNISTKKKGQEINDPQTTQANSRRGGRKSKDNQANTKIVDKNPYAALSEDTPPITSNNNQTQKRGKRGGGLADVFSDGSPDRPDTYTKYQRGNRGGSRRGGASPKKDNGNSNPVYRAKKTGEGN